ncbi:MAG: N-acetylglutaminylglutamine synthetase [Gemmatimonadales bacterium]|jgi:GNAT-family acetyltransferase (TIGR03103 family)
MSGKPEGPQRIKRREALTLRSWGDRPVGPAADRLDSDVVVDCGWGRLIFAHTFDDPRNLASALRAEGEGLRDIAFYVRDPHVVLALAPQELFLDPSHTYRLWLSSYRPPKMQPRGFTVRRLRTKADAEATNRIYASRGMVRTHPASFPWQQRRSDVLSYYVAEDRESGDIIGTVTGIDHVRAFNDPDNGSSLWCLAVDPQAAHPGIGQALTLRLAEHFVAQGRAFMDLSVMHDNEEAIALYEKLGFQRTPAFCVKRKNPINEPLFAPDHKDVELNPYAEIITDEARRRGIIVDMLDEQLAYFRLTLGGRSITCRESLTELTSAVAFCRCDDKRLSHRVLKAADLRVPAQQEAEGEAENNAFLAEYGQVVVKPARGEQGAGVSVDLRTAPELDEAIEAARRVCPDVVIEEFVEGQDLRVIVIGGEVVAAAVRKPPQVTGTGRHTVTELIEKYNRRRMAATGGKSKVPHDDETERCVRAAGYELDSVPVAGETFMVRKAANLHTGGTIHDVTEQVHPTLIEASVAAASALEIPVVGLDLAVPDIEGPEYAIIEANERPGLANHEPQPTAERFIDLLFPQTAVR